jgi:hypothetical protein
MLFRLYMKKRVFNILGWSFFLIGFIFALNYSSGITGFVVFEGEDFGFSSLIALWFLISGLVLIGMARDREGGLERKSKILKRKIGEALRSGKIGSYVELRRYALQLGYHIVEKGKHSIVYNGKEFVTTLPRGSGQVRTGTYRKILKELHGSIS